MNKEQILNLAKEIIDSNEIAIVGSISLKKYPNVRALQKMKNEGFNTFYFSTRSDSMKVRQMKKRKKGCVYFYDRPTYSTVMLEGEFKIEPNTTVGVSKLYELDPTDPYTFVTIKFITKYIYVYTHYKTVKFEINSNGEII